MVHRVDQVVGQALIRQPAAKAALGGLLAALFLFSLGPILSWLLSRDETRSATIARVDERARDEIAAVEGRLSRTVDRITEELASLESANRAALFELLSRSAPAPGVGVQISSPRGERLAWWGEQLPRVNCSGWCFDGTALYLTSERAAGNGDLLVRVTALERLELDELSSRLREQPVVEAVLFHARPGREAPEGAVRSTLKSARERAPLILDVVSSSRHERSRTLRTMSRAAGVTVLAATLLAIAFIGFRRASTRPRFELRDAAITTVLVGGARVMLLYLPVTDLGALFRFELFASRLLGPLSRSPLDLLLSSLTLLILTAVWIRALPPRHAQTLRWCFLAAAPPLLAVLLANVVENSRVMPVPAHVLPASPVQWVLSLALLATGFAFARFPDAANRPSRERIVSLLLVVTTAGALLVFVLSRRETIFEGWMVAHGIWAAGFISSSMVRSRGVLALLRAVTVVLALYPTLALFQREAATSFVSDTWAPLVMGESEQQMAMIEDIVERQFTRLDLAAVLPASYDETAMTNVAASLWRESDLSRIANPSLLILRDRTGTELSRYGAGGLDETWDSTISWEMPLREHDRIVGELEVLIANPSDPISAAETGGSASILQGREGRFTSFVEVLRPAVFDEVGNAASPPQVRFARSPFWYVQNLDPGSTEWIEPSSPENVIAYLHRTDEALYAFPLVLPTAGEHVRRVGSLLVTALLFLGLISLPWLWRELREALPTRGGFRTRMAATMAVLAALPFFLFMIFLRVYLAERLESEYLARGREALDAAQRVMRDYLESKPGERPEAVLDDEIFAWLARVVGHDLHLYRESELVASSRRELIGGRFDSEQLPGDVYMATVLGGSQLYLDARAFGQHEYVEIYSPILLTRGENWILGLPMLVQAQEITDEVDALATTLWLLMLLILAIALVAAARAARSVSDPVDSLANAAREVGRGNLEPSLPTTGDSELRLLVDTFREMAGSIRRQQQDLTFERDRLQTLLENIDVAVLLIEGGEIVSASNAAARELFGDHPTLDSLRESEFGPEVWTSDEPVRHLEIGRGSDARTWQVASVLLPGGNTRMILLEDVTEIVRSHRVEAWAEMARQIAHDIKNPLTPIQLTAEHLATLAERDDPRLRSAVAEGVGKILRQVEALRETSRDFNEFASSRALDVRPEPIDAFLRDVVAPYRTGDAPRVELVSDLDGTIAAVDRRVLAGALTNLIENAMQSGSSSVTVRGREEEGMIVIDVIDQGPGVAEEDLPRIFEPYFSTRSTGTGLGLAITRKAILEHGGTIEARNLEPGLRVTIRLPPL